MAEILVSMTKTGILSTSIGKVIHIIILCTIRMSKLPHLGNFNVYIVKSIMLG